MTSDSKNRTPSDIYLQRIGKKVKNLLPAYINAILPDTELMEGKEKEQEGKSSQELLDDKALAHPEDDEFGRDEFAKRISEILINKSTPDHLTIGIYGKWGEGKTSLVNFIKHYLEKEESDAIFIDFNPWRYKNEDVLLNSFFKQFAQGISHKLGENGQKLAKSILSYSGLIVALAEPVTGLSMFSSMDGWDKVKNYAGKIKSFVSDNDFSPAINTLERSLKESE